MSAGYVYVLSVPISHGVHRVIIHIGVGFCVARSDSDGQCEGLEVWDE